MLIEATILFVAKAIASQIVQDTWKTRVSALLWPKDTHVTRLSLIIWESIDEYKKEYPARETNGQIAFYESDLLFAKLSKFVLFEQGSISDIEAELSQNTNIKQPTNQELQTFYQLFLSKAKQDKKLKAHFIEENYKERIFKNATQLRELSRTMAAIEDNTEKLLLRTKPGSAELPKELTTLLPKLKKEKIVGRTAELEELKRRLFEGKQMVLLNGMGGIGKTILAAVYVGEFYEEYNHIVWVGATKEGLFQDLLTAPGLLEALQIEVDKSSEKTAHSLLLGLKRLKARNLMVIDNADETLAKYHAYLPGPPHWHVLISSREKIEHFDTMELGFLTEAEALELFKKHYTRKDVSDREIRQLVKNVELHTLTIEILAKTAQELRMTATKLDKAITENLETDIIIKHRDKKVGKILSYLGATFNLSQLSAEALLTLQYFSLLPTDYLKNDEIEEVLFFLKNILPKGRAELYKKGWLMYNEAEDAYKLHQVIFEVIQPSVEYTEAFTSPLIDSLATLLKADEKSNPVDIFKWIPFGNRVLDLLSNVKDLDLSTLQNNLALRLQDRGDYERAKELLEKAKNSDEKNFGTQHPTTATTYSNLALVLQDLGDYNGAKELLEKAKNSDEKNFGTEHPTTATRYSNLAMVLEKLGDYNRAKELLEKAKNSDEKNFGTEHPTTAIRYSNLAMVLKNLGDYKGAKELLEKAKNSAEKNFGTEHPNTAITYSNLALVLRDLGDYKGAKELLEKVKNSDEKNFGTQHPATATTYSNLALVLHDLGDYAAAKKLLEKAYQVFLTQLGEQHPSTKTIKENLEYVKKLMRQ